MPTIKAEGKTFEVTVGANLRESLLNQGIELYSTPAKILNCRGHGICGTCFVEVKGAVSERTDLETMRMILPPHSSHQNRRLACQVNVLGDLSVTRFDGYYGASERLLWTPMQQLS